MATLDQLKLYDISEERTCEIAEVIIDLDNISFICPPMEIYNYICNKCKIVQENEKQFIYDSVVDVVFNMNRN